MSDQTKDWATEFALEFYMASHTLPIIRAGSRPVLDITAVIAHGPGEIFWFYYTWADIPAEFWELIALTYRRRPDVVINLSNSHELSERIGIPVDDRNVPDLWVMAVEALDIT